MGTHVACIVVDLSCYERALDMFITNGIVSCTIYDKQNDYNFEIVNFPFLILMTSTTETYF